MERGAPDASMTKGFHGLHQHVALTIALTIVTTAGFVSLSTPMSQACDKNTIINESDSKKVKSSVIAVISIKVRAPMK